MQPVLTGIGHTEKTGHLWANVLPASRLLCPDIWVVLARRRKGGRKAAPSQPPFKPGRTWSTENWLLHWVCKEVAGTLRSHFHIQWWAIIQLLVPLAPCLACSCSGALRPLSGVLSVLFLSPFSCALWAHVLQPHGSTGLSLSEPLSFPTSSSLCWLSPASFLSYFQNTQCLGEKCPWIPTIFLWF